MRQSSSKPAAFLGSWKDIVLPAAFCVCSALILSAVVWPISNDVAAAADVLGYQAVPSPAALFVREAPEEPEAETVDLAASGGMPQEGELYGRVAISGTAVECNLYYGDSEQELHAGAGTFAGAQIPGQGGVALIAGHTGSYFRDLESVQLGADITIETRYGEYHYEVTDMRVVEASQFGMANLLAAPRESVMLYTCYPFGQLTMTPQRYMVTGEYVSGPAVVDSTEGDA